MTVEEVTSAIDELKKDASEEEILTAFAKMYKDGKIDINQLSALVKILGYELSDEFLKLSPEEQKDDKNLFEEKKPEASKEEIEDAKEVTPEEKKESEESEEEEKEGKESDEKSDDEKEKERLFRIAGLIK